MKILFIKHPRNILSISGDSNLEPLEFEILAAPLKNHHDISILDMRVEDKNNLNATLQKFQPDIVGLTGYTLDVNSILKLAEKIKEWNPRVKVVVGGHHATILPQDFYHGSVDLVVIGEGEVTFPELVTALEKGAPLENIPGIAINNKEGQVLTPQRPAITDLNGLPFPDRNLTKKYRSRYFTSIYRPIATMITSRGCPFKCNFCSVWRYMGGKYLTRDVMNVADELELIQEPNVYFIDDNLTTNVKHFEELYDEIKRRGIKKHYRALGRTDAIVKRPDLIEKWREIGLTEIILGIESVKNTGLDFLNKHNTTENNVEAMNILKDNGIHIKASFIAHPDFGYDDFKEISQFLEKVKIDTPYFTVLTPLPGTILYEELKDRIIIRDYEFYDLVHSVLPTKLPRKEFYNQFLGLYGYFSIPKSIKSTLHRAFNRLTGKPLKDIPVLPLRRAVFNSIILPIVAKRHYRREMLPAD